MTITLFGPQDSRGRWSKGTEYITLVILSYSLAHHGYIWNSPGA